jgi:hypothetical protein
MLLNSIRMHITSSKLQSCLSGHMLMAVPALVGMYSSSSSSSSNTVAQ